jgi:hypothetical protein
MLPKETRRFLLAELADPFLIPLFDLDIFSQSSNFAVTLRSTLPGTTAT